MSDGIDIVALIVGVLSASVSIISIYLNSNNNIKLAEINKKFASEKDEETAIRTYKYNANLRLYKEYEPLIFQLHELSESALFRIMGIARNARTYTLLEYRDYFTKRTVYRILAPMIVFKQMSRRLTLFDLNLNPYFKIQYILSKILYHTLDKDIELSELDPKLITIFDHNLTLNKKGKE